MCKHVAAVLYGVGARLDHQPELFFHLRKVDHLELIEEAVSTAGRTTATRKKTLAEADVAGVFGIEIAGPEAADVPPSAGEQPAKPKRRKASPTTPKPAAAPRRAPKAGKGRRSQPGA
jgi:uncharacterized Zn finger protein